MHYFPDECVPLYYLKKNPDLAVSPEQALVHYEAYGKEDGRLASPCALREVFMRLPPSEASVLEIGPYFSPAVRGQNVRYFDVLTAEELRQKCAIDNGNPQTVPAEIHYVSRTGDLSIVDARFDFVVSCHCIEHQPDLVRHLVNVQNLLHEGGAYLLAVPDKRYCFDHFRPLTEPGRVLEAWLCKRINHTFSSFFAMSAETTHNDNLRHWQGDHGAPAPLTAEKAAELLREYEERSGRGEYVDCHTWFFTPDSFRALMVLLYELGLTELYPHRVYASLAGRNEFCAVLIKKEREG